MDIPIFNSPILLPHKCVLIEKLIEHFQRESYYAENHILLSILGENVWIIRGMKTARNGLKGCYKCQYFKIKFSLSNPVFLPADREEDGGNLE